MASVKDYGGADAFDKLLEELLKAAFTSGERLSPHFIPRQTLLSELKIRLGQRRIHWMGLALQHAREAEQKRKSPVAQGESTAEQISQEEANPITTPTSGPVELRCRSRTALTRLPP